MDNFRYLYTKIDNMDINEDKISYNNNNINLQKSNIKNSNTSKQEYYKSNKLVFMDIVVESGMCQGVYFNKENVALKCTKKAKFCKNKKFMVCEKHKNQCFGN